MKHEVSFGYNNDDIGIEELKAEPAKCLSHIHKIEEIETNPFPFDVFPEQIQQIIEATNNCLNFPIDFIGASMLYAASVAIGNTHWVEIKRGFQERAVIYLAIVGRPGTNKSHPLTFALNPIYERDNFTYREYETKKKAYDTSSKLTKIERKEGGIEETEQPYLAKKLISDFTQEALSEVHKNNKRGIGVYVDELAGWFKNFNRYNKGSEVEFWLSNWCGKPMIIDRKTGEPINISKPFISVAGTIQNAILHDLAKDNRTENGFIDRILFVILNNIKKPYWNDSEIDNVYIDNWKIVISNLMNLPIEFDETNNPMPEILHFTPDAKQLLFQWQKKNTDQCNTEESDTISGIYSKFDMHIARLALILEMLNWACAKSDKQAIGIEATKGAIKLAEYFKKYAYKVNAIMSNTNPIDKLPNDKQNLYNALPDNFSTIKGLQIAESLNIPERSFERFLKNKDLFKKKFRGEYEKVI